ncbi:MAG TPA: YicC/YloC family endoribonuclease [Devosiaceae bacterium]|jgi:uncharacterized protein (TIGR00255 family)|nr:YicC/YloC family endoribonuclease [Devosiaceae bacterium]
MGGPVASMTGYARARGEIEGVRFQLEIKSVNARGLDIRSRIAPGYDALEGEIRRRLTAALSRGSVTLTLNVEGESEGGAVTVNRQALDAVLAAIADLSGRIDAERPRLEGILALRGVLEQHENPLSAEAEQAVGEAVLAAADAAIADLMKVRREEGARLARVLGERLDEIAALCKTAELHPGRSRDAILERLRSQLAELTATGAGLPEDRLAQEALLLATKADIREELDRLAAHVAAARQLLAAGGAVGRKLDFLSQEFNREANTLCSKSNAVELTAVGLDLKAVIDQFREQVQNIE